LEIQSKAEREKIIAELDGDLRHCEDLLSQQQNPTDLATLYFSFSMTRNRKEFIFPSLVMLLVLFFSFEMIALPILRFVMPIFFAISFWSLLALFMGRLRELGHRKIWVFMSLVPIVNVFLYIYLLCAPTRK